MHNGSFYGGENNSREYKLLLFLYQLAETIMEES